MKHRSDGLWIEIEKWNPSGKALLAAGQYKYFSPVIKGLDNQTPLRVTSVTLTNTPKLNGLPELAAAELNFIPNPLNRKDMTMNNEKNKDTPCAD